MGGGLSKVKGGGVSSSLSPCSYSIDTISILVVGAPDSEESSVVLWFELLPIGTGINFVTLILSLHLDYTLHSIFSR